MLAPSGSAMVRLAGHRGSKGRDNCLEVGGGSNFTAQGGGESSALVVCNELSPYSAVFVKDPREVPKSNINGGPVVIKCVGGENIDEN